MKLLILTQKVDKNDDVLGFFHGWLQEFAKNCEKVFVVALKVGEYELPPNVFVYSLGKENGESKSKYIIKFLRYIFSLRNEYDSVFIHMNQVYVLLGGIFWRLWNKKTALWYVHRQNGLDLKIAEKLVNYVFTSSPESFTVKSKKVIYIGHGVDSSKLTCDGTVGPADKVKIVHVGRISPIKDLVTLVLAGEILSKKIPNLLIEFYGKTGNDADEKYLNAIKLIIKEKELGRIISFRGSIPNTEISKVYCSATISANMAPKGGWDKAVIESLMAKCPVFASNLALKPVFGEYSNKFLFEHKNPLELANKIESFLAENEKEKIINNLREHAIKEYDIKNLVKKITSKLS